MNITQVLKILENNPDYKASRVDWSFKKYIYLGEESYNKNYLFCNSVYNFQSQLRFEELSDDKWFIIK